MLQHFERWEKILDKKFETIFFQLLQKNTIDLYSIINFNANSNKLCIVYEINFIQKYSKKKLISRNIIIEFENDDENSNNEQITQMISQFISLDFNLIETFNENIFFDKKNWCSKCNHFNNEHKYSKCRICNKMWKRCQIIDDCHDEH